MVTVVFAETALQLLLPVVVKVRITEPAVLSAAEGV
jgi:hypothetical protein